MKFTKHISILLFVLISSIASAQVKFEAKVSKMIVGIDEIFEVSFHTNLHSAKFTPPKFNNFIQMNAEAIILDSTKQKSDSFKKTYIYHIVPKKAGKFLIEEARLIYQKSLYKTKSTEVEVVNESHYNPMPEETIEDRFDNGIHIIAEASKTKLSLNDSLVISYKLYFAHEVGVKNYKVKKESNYSDFIVTRVKPSRAIIKNQTFKKKDYRTVTLKKVILKPIDKGTFEIPPVELEIESNIPFYKKEESRMIKRLKRFTKTIKSNTLKIVISE